MSWRAQIINDGREHHCRGIVVSIAKMQNNWYDYCNDDNDNRSETEDQQYPLTFRVDNPGFMYETWFIDSIS
jgi:hypothetical protein